MGTILGILGIIFLFIIGMSVLENKKGTNSAWIDDRHKTPQEIAVDHYSIASRKYFMKDYSGAISHFKLAIDHNPARVYTMLCTCYYLVAQQILSKNGNELNLIVIDEYKNGFNAILKALEYSTTDRHDVMERNYLAGIMSGVLNTFYSTDFSNTKMYLTIAIKYGSSDAKDLLSTIN